MKKITFAIVILLMVFSYNAMAQVAYDVSPDCQTVTITDQLNMTSTLTNAQVDQIIESSEKERNDYAILAQQDDIKIFVGLGAKDALEQCTNSQLNIIEKGK